MQHTSSGLRTHKQLRNIGIATLCTLSIVSQTALADTGGCTNSDSVSNSVQYISYAKRRPTVALALGGGGMRGATHIGVLRVLEREKIHIDSIVGTSMGAIVGGLYCAGVSLDDIEKMLTDGSFTKAYQPRPMIVQSMLQPIALLKNLVTKNPPAGLYTGKSLKRFFDKTIPANKRNIEDLDIKFTAVATDLCSGKLHTFTSGSLSDAIRASSSIPIALRPVEIDGRLYIDGNMRTSVPAHIAKEENADIVIGIQSDEQLCDKDKKSFQSYLPIFDQMVNVVQTQFCERDKDDIDLLIWPKLSGIPLYARQPKLAQQAIQCGEEAAEKALPELKKLISATIARKNGKDNSSSNDL